MMADADVAKLPECFREIVQIDRRRRGSEVVAFADIRERRHQRRMCEIFCLDRLRGAGPSLASALRF